MKTYDQEKIKATLPILLKSLHLPTFNQLWENMSREAELHGWGCARYLQVLAEHEISGRDSRRLMRFMKESQLPTGKTFATFDFTSAPMVNKSQMHAYGCGVSWIEEGGNLLIFGPSGVGKTHLASAIGTSLVENGFRVLFKRTTEILQQLLLAKKEFRLPSELQKLDKFDCLILDDFGYVKKDQIETSVLFELISERYERKSILITCNQPFSEWDDIFEDKAMTVASIDRLVHHAKIVEINKESYRKEEALKRKDK